MLTPVETHLSFLNIQITNNIELIGIWHIPNIPKKITINVCTLHSKITLTQGKP